MACPDGSNCVGGRCDKCGVSPNFAFLGPATPLFAGAGTCIDTTTNQLS